MLRIAFVALALLSMASPAISLNVSVKAHEFWGSFSPINGEIGNYIEVTLKDGDTANCYVSSQGVPNPDNFQTQFELKRGEITHLYMPPNYGTAFYAFYANDKDVVIEAYKFDGNYDSCHFQWCADGQTCSPKTDTTYECVAA